MAETLSHEAPAHDAASLPVMLPGKLVGRDAVLTQIYARLKENRAVLIHGSAGIGKTALAAMLASAYTDLPGGVLWLHVHNAALPELLVQIGRAYGDMEIANTETPLGMVGAVANLLTRHKPLVVLDGKFDAATAEGFISRCAENLPVLLVTEEALEGEWATFHLDPLAPEQAAVMFKTIARMDGADGEENDYDIAGLVAALGHNPFAIAMAAGAVRANKQPPAQFRASLPTQPNVSGQILALTASFRTLNNALQGLLLMLGATVNGQGSAELLSLISGAPVEAIQQAMNLLVARQLIEKFDRYDKPYYRLHSITYAFTQPLLRGSGKLDELREKARRAVIDYVRRYSDNPNQLAMEVETMMQLARAAVAQGDRDTANELAVALMQAGDFVGERGYLYELLTLRRMAASSVSAFPAYDSPTATQPLPFGMPTEDEDLDEEDLGDEFADAFEDEEEDEEAFEDELDDEDMLDEAVDEEEEDVLEDAGLVGSIFGAAVEDDEDEADEDDGDEIEYVTVALPTASEDDEDAAEQDAEAEAPPAPAPIRPPLPMPPAPPPTMIPPLNEPAEVASLRAMLVTARGTGSLQQQAALLHQIGQAQLRADLDTAAQASFNEALTLYDSVGDKNGSLDVLVSLTKLTAAVDDAQASALHAMRGIDLARESGDDARRLDLLTLLGDAHQQLGEADDALDAYTQALELARQSGDSAKTAGALLKLGYAQLDEGKPQAAVKSWEEALPLFRENDQAENEARVLGGLGTAYGELGRWEESLNFHNSALYLARAAGDKDEEALQLSNLGYAAVQAGKLGDAVLRYRQSLHLAYTMDNRDNIVSTIVDLAGLLVRSPRHLMIAELLVDDAINRDPTDRDVMRLKERINVEKINAEEKGIPQNPVGGTAREYAEMAYKLLDE
jgi:tetratricopeptide (TPR) repeat protein